MALPAPQNFSAWVDQSNRIQTDWIGVPDAIGYNLYELNSPNGVSGNPTTYTNSVRGPFTETRTFTYWVKAVAKDGSLSPESNRVSVAYKQSDVATPPANAGKVLFALDETKGNTSLGGMDDWPQWQDNNGNIYKGSPLPIVDHPLLGRAVKTTLPYRGERREVMPPSNVRNLSEGTERYVRKDIVLGNDFPLSQSNYWCIIDQVHQSSGSGSPPIEFDVHDNALWVRGNSNKYNEKLYPLKLNTVYKLVYRVVVSSSASKSLLEVWINDTKVLSNFRPPIAFKESGGDSYLKGIGLYADPSVAPRSGMTVYDARYKIGTSYSAVAS